jgi:1-acyl-sn-glycerol-3-phosphate acyltransferase
VVIAPVHRSAVDFGFSIFLTKRKIFFMAKDQIWKHRALGKLLIVLGAFPVHRESADRSALEHAEAVLRAGGVLVMFPEGTRQSGNRVIEIMEGATFLAARTGATVIPLGIAGSEAAWPRGQKLPRPHRVFLYASEAITPPTRTAKGRVSRSALRVMTEQLRGALEQSLKDAASIARATK